MPQIYAFFCARYGNIKYNDLLNMGYEEFTMKLTSIPESEPLFNIIKSRSINVAKIKDKEERKYWQKQKELNKIPDCYLLEDEINENLKNQIKLGGYTNGKGIN